MDAGFPVWVEGWDVGCELWGFKLGSSEFR